MFTYTIWIHYVKFFFTHRLSTFAISNVGDISYEVGLLLVTWNRVRVTLSLALPLWLRFIIFGWISNTQHIFAHLVPQGIPPILIPFIVCIEIIRNLIRPGTLAVRLAANIIAEDLLLPLLENTGSFLSTSLVYTERFWRYLFRRWWALKSIIFHAITVNCFFFFFIARLH